MEMQAEAERRKRAQVLESEGCIWLLFFSAGSAGIFYSSLVKRD
jgi:hypothetical protein